MASARYTLNIPPEAPEEKHEMTKKERRENWWFYHKWTLLISLAAVAIVAWLSYDIITNVQPDYQIGFLDERMLPAGVTETLETNLAQFFDDRNGDGKIAVSVVEYTLPFTEEGDNDPNMRMANMTRLMADAQSGETMIFLTKTPQAFQKEYGILADNDGKTPPEGTAPTENFGILWKDCPVLTQLPLGDITGYDGTNLGTMQDFLSDYKLLRRAFEGTALAGKEKELPRYESAMRIFDAMTAQ
ncbi:MAG: hypothetical protein RR415_09600 [Ruthenibacterium sp.]